MHRGGVPRHEIIALRGRGRQICQIAPLQPGIGQRSEVVLSSVEVSKSAKFLIHRHQFFRPHASGTNGIEEKYRPQSILRQQRFNVREDAAPVYRRKWMGKAVDFHDGDVLIAQQLDHPSHKTRRQQRYIAAGRVGEFHGIRQGPEPSSQTFQRSFCLAFISGNGHAIVVGLQQFFNAVAGLRHILHYQDDRPRVVFPVHQNAFFFALFLRGLGSSALAQQS